MSTAEFFNLHMSFESSLMTGWMILLSSRLHPPSFYCITYRIYPCSIL